MARTGPHSETPSQPSHILVTKLFLPHSPPSFVARPRLIERLNEGLRGKLILISAPAGFGKTTLISEWVNQPKAEGGRRKEEAEDTTHPSSFLPQPSHVAWLSLDEGDSDPTRFLTYLVAAAQTIAPHVGAAMLSMLQSPQPPPAEAMLTTLLNDIATLPDRFLLVLDDYHVVDARPVDQALAFLLERLPPQMRVVITTREDPQLPLARYRARGQLTELRAADLRFTPSEAATFLNQAMGLNLAADAIAALEERTEGWIAGLQLAALSMRGRDDIAGFIQGFAGDNRYIVDYLAEEVLKRQPPPVRRFLLQTAILDRLTGPLCDAVLGKDEGGGMRDEQESGSASSSAMLEHLERANLFLTPLDNRRQWYRYHHLFADVLAAHVLAEQPDLVVTLHRRASEWYERHGAVDDAIRHALAGQDFERAADLVERATPAMRRSRQEAVLLGWFRALPAALLRVRPVLSAAYAGALLASNELEDVEGRLRDAERWLDAAADRRAMVVVDEEAFRLLPGSIAVWRAGQALVRGDVAATVTYAQRALALLAEEDHLGRGGAVALLGLAAWTGGDLEAARRQYAEGMARLLLAGYVSDALGCVIVRADILMTQGRLREARRIYEQGLRLATGPDTHGAAVRGAADMYVGLSALDYERGDLKAATQALLRSQELGEHMALPQNRYRWRVMMARLRQAQGDLDGALDLLHAAERLYVGDFSPNVRPVAALTARVWIAQGRVGDALSWARERGLSVADDLNYLREFEHITLARALLARYQRDGADSSLREAMMLLGRLLQAAEAGERMGSVIEILTLQALAHQRRGDLPAALAALERALTLAEPEGYARLFVDEGPAMAELLKRLETRDWRLREYVTTLLGTFSVGAAPTRLQSPVSNPQSPIASPQPLIEPLSERELDVLRLLGTDLSGPDMARQLMVSLNTLRTHTKNIYAKLGVNNRRAAVHRAEELDLV